MLRRVGVDPSAQPGFWYHFRAAGTKGDRSRNHATRAETSRSRYYRTPGLVRAILGHYAPDYRSFDIEVPAWAVEAVGAEFVESLGLRIPTTLPPCLRLSETISCAPDAGKLSRMLPAPAARPSVRESTRFYLDEEGAFSSSELHECFEREFQLAPGECTYDDHLSTEFAEHMGDLMLYRQLKEHPNRVFDPADASVIFTGITPSTSFFTSRLEGQPCGVHHQRMAEAAAQLEMKLAQNLDAVYVIASTHWNTKKTLGKLLRVIRQNPERAWLATADLSFGRTEFNVGLEGKLALDQMLVIPYAVNYRLEAAAHDMQGLGEHRNTSFFFAGNMGRNGHGSLRGPAIGAIKASSAASLVEDHDFGSDTSESRCGQSFWGEKVFPQTRSHRTSLAHGPPPPPLPPVSPSFTTHSRAELGLKTSGNIRGSKFCLVPEGDTPTSRRIFETLAGGCVPVVLGRIDDYSERVSIPRNLPFRHTIDWGSIALFAGSLTCYSPERLVSTGDAPRKKGQRDAEYSRAQARALARWLEAAAAKEGGEGCVEDMRRRGQQVFREALSYGPGGGASSSLLVEIGVKLRRRMRNPPP